MVFHSLSPEGDGKALHMEKFKLLLGSRKFWAAMVSLALVIVKAFFPDFPLEDEQLTGVITVIVAYIIGTGLEDGLSRANPTKP